MKIHLTSALLVCGVATSLAFAADPPKKGTPMLTKDQLRACMAQKDQLTKRDEDLAKEKAEITTVKDGIARDGEALKTKLETLDRTNPEAVNAYNEQTTARDKQIDDYQVRVTAFNTRVDALSTDRDGYAKACLNRRYLEEDEIAIKKGK